MRKIHDTKDPSGLLWIVDDELCRRVSLQEDITGTEVQQGEYLLPEKPYPWKAYEVKWIYSRDTLVAIEFEKETLVRDLTLQRFYDGHGMERSDTAIEEKYKIREIQRRDKR